LKSAFSNRVDLISQTGMFNSRENSKPETAVFNNKSTFENNDDVIFVYQRR